MTNLKCVSGASVESTDLTELPVYLWLKHFNIPVYMCDLLYFLENHTSALHVFATLTQMDCIYILLF